MLLIYKRNFVLLSTEGLKQPEWSPCTQNTTSENCILRTFFETLCLARGPRVRFSFCSARLPRSKWQRTYDDLILTLNKRLWKSRHIPETSTFTFDHKKHCEIETRPHFTVRFLFSHRRIWKNVALSHKVFLMNHTECTIASCTVWIFIIFR